MPPACGICGNAADNRLHRTREMMLGTRDEFDYVECRQCGTLQIVEIPDLSLYYPANYYSFVPATDRDLRISFRRRFAAGRIGVHYLGERSLTGKYLVRTRPWIAELFPKFLKEFPGSLNFDTRILDFGCGNGQLLRILSGFGFRSLTGTDVFIESDISYQDGVRIYKTALKDLKPAFDLIMLNHSFEHLPDPLESLRQTRRLLADTGTALIRMPIVNFAWEKYGVNWVQLDPPRHLFLYTEKSFRRVVSDAGFEVSKMVYDSEAFQFFGSEQYIMDIPMNDPRSFRGVSETSIFSQQEIDEWTRQAEKLNAEMRGDQACFYLRKA